MGPFCSKKGIQDSFFKETLSFPNAGFPSTDRKSCPGGRGQETPIERGSGENKSGRSRILFSYFPSSQEEREITTHNRSIQTECFSEHSVVQNGNSKQSQTLNSTQRLGVLSGSDRCLFTHTHSQTVSEISTILSQGSGVSVQGSPVRISHKSFCVYSHDGCHSSPFAKEVHSSVSISGRLVGQESDSFRYPQRPTFHCHVDNIPRTDYQRREVGVNSFPEFCVYRNGISDRQKYCSGTMGQSTRHPESCTLVQGTEPCVSKDVSVSIRETECSCPVSYFGQTSFTPSTNGIICTMETAYSAIRTSHSDQYSDQESLRMVEQQRSFSSGCNTETTSSHSHSFHGRESFRLGCPSRTGGTSVSWSLVSGSICSTHQCFRDESDFLSSKTVPSVCQKYHCNDSHGQFISGRLSEETGRYPLPISLHGGVGYSSLVRQEKHKSSCSSYSWQNERTGRQVESSFQTYCNGMVPGSDDLQFNPGDDRLSEHRSVCNSVEQQTSSVCIPDSRRQSSRDRCPVNELGRNARLCVSAFCSNSGDSQQNSPTSVQNCSGSTIMARNVLVSRITSVTRSTSNSTSGRMEFANSSPLCKGKRGKSSITRLGIVRKSIRDKSFSQEVANLAAKARRASTRKVYDAKWNVFSDWCLKREIPPDKATSANVADFLLHLFQEKKSQVSTIKGYRSTISNTLKFKSGQNVGSDPIISELIKSMELQRPVQRSLAPKWDLSCVLSSLCSEPYEPLHRASRFHLTLKTVFLLALATARRVSEIHAFSMDSGYLRFNQSDGSVSLRTQPGFLAKNQLPSVCPDDILVQNLSKTVKWNDFNRLLCPVRALKRYLKVTEPIRLNRKRLFLPLKGNHDITKGSISGWITYTIRLAYKNVSKSKVALLKIKAHELRALSASWSYFNKTPVEDIIKAAVWSSSSTFAKFYLRDLQNGQGDNLRLLGPVVSAQKVVGGRSGLPIQDC